MILFWSTRFGNRYTFRCTSKCTKTNFSDWEVVGCSDDAAVFGVVVGLLVGNAVSDAAGLAFGDAVGEEVGEAVVETAGVAVQLLFVSYLSI